MLVEEELCYKIRGAVFEVYNTLGHGYLEKVYERALKLELRTRGVDAQCQVPACVRYKGEVVGEYFADVLVEHKILLELKAQTRISRADEAGGLRVGMLVNFTYPKAQIRRLVR